MFACMEGALHVPGLAAPSYYTPYEPKLSAEKIDKTISHLVSMALFFETSSVDSQNRAESPNRVEPVYNTFKEQGVLPALNIPHLSDLVSDVMPMKPVKKTPRRRPTPSKGPQDIDVKALIEAKMNSNELSSPMERQRIAEMDAVIQDYLRGDVQDEISPALQNHPDTSTEDQKGQPLLWKFIFKLLEYSGSNPSLVMWVNRAEGEFQIVQPKPVAYLWGLVKNNEGMNYEKLSRGLRYYYKTGILVPVRGRLLYKFSAKAKIWNLMKNPQSSTLQNQHTSQTPSTSLDMSGYIPIPNENTSHMDTNQYKDVLDVIGAMETSSSSSSSYDSSPEAFCGQQQALMTFNESMDLL